MTALTLYELNNLVAQTIALQLPGEHWVQAELSEARESRGHCYMELIQKEEGTNTPVARASAKCWKSKWVMLGPHFERVTGQRLHPGMKVLLNVYAQFHEAYGFSWIVTDINPEYTMGDMARRRQEIIRQLKAEGIFDLQRELEIPLFARRIAVISSATAAGYGDFCNQLAQNTHGFQFETRLFAATMQGEQVEQSIIEALDAIHAEVDDYDCVVIIRGGGGAADLSGFDSLRLAENVAQFPLPVITGIGHERDESIVDLVAHTRAKTPTAVAALLIDHLHQVAQCIERAAERLTAHTVRRMDRERLRLNSLAEKIPMLCTVASSRQAARIDSLTQRIPPATALLMARHRHRLDLLAQSIEPLLRRTMTAQQHCLDLLAQRTEALQPERLLRRGYSITLVNGRALRSVADVAAGDVIETRLADGSITSTIR